MSTMSAFQPVDGGAWLVYYKMIAKGNLNKNSSQVEEKVFCVLEICQDSFSRENPS